MGNFAPGSVTLEMLEIGFAFVCIGVYSKQGGNLDIWLPTKCGVLDVVLDRATCRPRIQQSILVHAMFIVEIDFAPRE